MKRADIEQRVKRVLTEQTGRSTYQFNDDSLFCEDLNMDSLDTFEMILAIEEEFDVDISPAEAEMLKTPRLLCDWLSEKTS